jgi:hypothetical protein
MFEDELMMFFLFLKTVKKKIYKKKTFCSDTFNKMQKKKDEKM